MLVRRILFSIHSLVEAGSTLSSNRNSPWRALPELFVLPGSYPFEVWLDKGGASTELVCQYAMQARSSENRRHLRSGELRAGMIIESWKTRECSPEDRNVVPGCKLKFDCRVLASQTGETIDSLEGLLLLCGSRLDVDTQAHIVGIFPDSRGYCDGESLTGRPMGSVMLMTRRNDEHDLETVARRVEEAAVGSRLVMTLDDFNSVMDRT